LGNTHTYIVNKASMHVSGGMGPFRGCLPLRICADFTIINIERGADWVRICKNNKFFWGCGLINFLYGIRVYNIDKDIRIIQYL